MHAYIYKSKQESSENSVFEIQPNGLVVTSCYYGAAVLWQVKTTKVTLPTLQFHWNNYILDLQAFVYKPEQEKHKWVFAIQPNGLAVATVPPFQDSIK